jgi:hypothetical protein
MMRRLLSGWEKDFERVKEMAIFTMPARPAIFPDNLAKYLMKPGSYF